MNTYIYNGPVNHFDKCIDRQYIAVTRATSEKQARNNLAYRYKINNGFTRNAKISLPGDIKQVS